MLVLAPVIQRVLFRQPLDQSPNFTHRLKMKLYVGCTFSMTFQEFPNEHRLNYPCPIILTHLYRLQFTYPTD